MCSAFPTQVPKRRQGNNDLSPNIVGGYPSRSELITDDPQTSRWRSHPLRPAPSITEIYQRPRLALAETVPPLCATKIDSLHHAQVALAEPDLAMSAVTLWWHGWGNWRDTTCLHHWTCKASCSTMSSADSWLRTHEMPDPAGMNRLLIGLNGQVAASQGLRGQLHHPWSFRQICLHSSMPFLDSLSKRVGVTDVRSAGCTSHHDLWPACFSNLAAI